MGRMHAGLSGFTLERPNALGPDVPTAATDGALLYVLKDNGTMNCLDLKTGKPVSGDWPFLVEKLWVGNLARRN